MPAGLFQGICCRCGWGGCARSARNPGQGSRVWGEGQEPRFILPCPRSWSDPERPSNPTFTAGEPFQVAQPSI